MALSSFRCRKVYLFGLMALAIRCMFQNYFKIFSFPVLPFNNSVGNDSANFFKLGSVKRVEGIDSTFNRKPSHPWKGDPLCGHFIVQLAKRDSLPKWPITSFPGSGVTWTRQLIEGVTGVYTGSVYIGDPSPVLSLGKENDNTDDPLCGCTIIDKDHEATITTLGLASYFELLHRYGNAGIVHQQYDGRGVLLLRNPMDVVFAYQNWVHGGKTGKAPAEAFSGTKWDQTVKYVAYAWADHAIRWIEQIKNGTVLFYEKLIGNAAELELERLLNVLDFHPIDANRMRCTLAYRNRTDHMRLNKPRKYLDSDQRIKLMKAAHQVQQSLRRKGWPTLPMYLYDFHSPDGNL